VLSGVSPLLTPEELEYQLNDSGAKVLVTLDSLFGNVQQVVQNTEVRAIARSIGGYPAAEAEESDLPAQLASLPEPSPGPGQVTIRQEASSVNAVDYKIRQGGATGIAPARSPPFARAAGIELEPPWRASCLSLCLGGKHVKGRAVVDQHGRP